jgi:hypothetical protein
MSTGMRFRADGRATRDGAALRCRDWPPFMNVWYPHLVGNDLTGISPKSLVETSKRRLLDDVDTAPHHK